MNLSPDGSDPFAEEQASLWAARMEGSTLGATERAELDAWLAGSAVRRELFSRYCRFSARLDRLLPALTGASGIKTSIAPVPSRRRFTARTLASAGLAAAAVAMAVVLLARTGARPENISTPAGRRGSFTLADGTRVELNANTSIFVENGPAERRVRLANGEAFFVVSKDKTRPFVVETPAGSVRVTGTIFNVLTEAATQLEVTVVEGSVQVRPGQRAGVPSPGALALGAGDTLSTAEGGVTLRPLSAGDIDDALAWRQGQIVCKGLPLAEVLARFAHYHGRVITATAGAANKRIGGRYSLGDLDGFLAQLAILKMHVAYSADGAVQVSLASP